MIAALPLGYYHSNHLFAETDRVLIWQILWSEISINAS